MDPYGSIRKEQVVLALYQKQGLILGDFCSTCTNLHRSRFNCTVRFQSLNLLLSIGTNMQNISAERLEISQNYSIFYPEYFFIFFISYIT